MKILVDKLPENKYNCPFYYSDDDIDGVYGSCCRLSGGDYCTLGCYEPYRCEYLKTIKEYMENPEEEREEE